jgi:hypothetical protein
MDDIEKIKQRRKADAYDTARDALAQLGKSDKPGYRRLVGALDPENKPGIL